ncbi:hypothetical protein SAMN05518865_10168 [Duganella sp. CF458]|uniref:hypothetical protein n=1 Tax=Duganella sp. CF458 TaxID=1884368 RepID=UPI0008E7AC3E|nr:hypothetical protein [Duganella sp. CF458]SFF51219.1 hypothetical protein SAMN05518865_10168 [Duganella sp. CF458]
MNKILIGFAVVVAAAGLGYVQYMKGEVAARYSPDALKQIAAESNKELPVMVDHLTRLDAVMATERTLEKRYTLVTAQASESLQAELTTKLFPVIKEQSCQNQQSKELYQHGVSEAFTYSDMNEKPVASITLNKNSCTQ